MLAKNFKMRVVISQRNSSENKNEGDNILKQPEKPTSMSSRGRKTSSEGRIGK